MAKYRVRGPNGAVALITVPSPGLDQRTFDRRLEAGELTVLKTIEGSPPADTPVESEDSTPTEKPLTVDDVLTRVGDNPERARAALEAEQVRGEDARSTLISALEKIASPTEDAEDD